MDKLSELRNEINETDSQLTELFEKRMRLVLEVAKYKEENGLPVLNASREREILTRVTENQGDELASYTKVLFTTLFDLSRSYQSRSLSQGSKLVSEIKQSTAGTQKVFPKGATVAVQGIEGANSQIACDRLFARPNITYMNSFDAVFMSVEKGLCEYGILPIENSLHGSVIEVYDLMRKYRFHIAKGVKIKIDHVLLGKHGTVLGDIKEIFSMEQALGQCGEFLKNMKGVKITPCENTAIAAQKVAESERTDVAAIAGKSCSELYDLSVLCDDIQNNDNNYTRFICISKKIEIYPGANKTSLMFTVPHKPGSLYGIISKFSALGVNLTKLESRPIPGRDFEFMFYADLEADICDSGVLNLLAQLEAAAEKFVFLGSYLEI